MRLEVRLLGAGELARLTDREHAAIVELVAGMLREVGFLVEPEASFSEWGERGRIDLLAFDPRSGTLVIVEVKSALVDLQDLFGSLNVKERLVESLVRARDWSVKRRVTLLAIADTPSNRATVKRHASLFAPFAVRRLGVAALVGADRRILQWVTPVRANDGRAWISGRQRVRSASRTRTAAHSARSEPAQPEARESA